MADTKPLATVVAPAPTRTALVDSNGIMTSPWVMWFQKVQTRIGGSYSLPLGATAGTWAPIFTAAPVAAVYSASYMSFGNQVFFDIVIDASDGTFSMNNGSITLPFPAISPGTMSAINLDPAAPYHDFGNGRIVDGFAYPPDFSIDHQKALLSGRYMFQ